MYLNDRPSKKLGYKTPVKLMVEHMVAIAAWGLFTSKLNLSIGQYDQGFRYLYAIT